MNFLRSVLMAAAAAPAKTGSNPSAPAAPAASLKIPSMKEITTGEPKPPGEGTPPVAPVVPPVAPAPNTPPAVAAPAAPVVPGSNGDDEPVIPTAIITPPGKTPQQFAEERRKEKGQRMTETELQTQYAQATAQLVEIQAERDKLKEERDRLAQEKADFERLAQTKEGEINNFKSTWAQQNRVTYNPGEDEVVRTADQTMKRLMQENFPLVVPGSQTDANGQPIAERVFAETVLNSPEEQERLHGVLAHYANARHNRNNAAIDMAVNMMAQVLGANVKIEGTDQSQWKLLPRNDATFQKIEQAMAAALPSFHQKIARMTEIQKDGPKFAVEAFGKRADGIRQNLTTGIFLDPPTVQRRLQSDPNDPIALFAAIASQAPDLRTESEALLGRFAESFATVGDQLYLPTLKGNTPQEVEEHMQQVQTHRARLADIMRYAVVGASSGKIIAQLIAERDAAEARAGRAAVAENPGSPSSTGGAGGAVGDDVEIPTTIVTR